MKLKLLLALFVFQGLISFSQEKCGSEKHQELHFKNDPEAKKNQDKIELDLLQKGVQEFLKEKNVSKNTVYEIPVVVHLMNDGTTPLRTDAEIINWIETCNKYYDTTLGGDWLAANNGGTVIPFKLVLAKRSPNCTSTTGINQIDVTSTYAQYSDKGLNSDNSDGVSEAQLMALSRWDPQLYYNIYIVNTFDSTPISQAGGLQGYAYFPGSSDSVYGTFMKASVVVSGDQSTLAHEFGHSMGLHHPFRTGSTTACPTVTTGGCSTDNDMVCDTPSTKSLLGVDPLPANTDTNECDTNGWNNVQYNVMNYTSSSRLFTPGQKDRGLALFLASRENLTKSLGGTAPTGNTPPTVVAATCSPPNNPVNTGNFAFGMTLVEIGDIKNASSPSLASNNNQAYYDYTTNSCLTTAFTTDLIIANNPQTIKLKNGGPNDGVYSAWIDYNNDGAFTANELIVTDESIAKETEKQFNFTIPSSNVTLGTPLRMRVIGDSQANSTAPCAQLQYGEVEDYIVVLKSSLSTPDFSSSLSITPNPTNDILKISFDRIISKVTVLNLAGQVVLTKDFNKENIDLNLSKLSSAIYFVNITTEDTTITKKIIKK